MNASVDRSCSVCTLSCRDLGVAIDESGRCNVCAYEAEHGKGKAAGWNALDDMTRPLRGGDYDCLVCWSGGKDSTFVVDYLARVRGWRVATFTFDNSFIAPGAFDNIDRIREKLGVTHFTVKAEAEEYRTNLRAALEGFGTLPKDSIYYKTIREYGPVCYLCGAIFHSVAVKLAAKLGCRLIATGFTVGQDPLYYADYRTQDAKEFAQKLAHAKRTRLHSVEHWYGVGRLLRRYLGEAEETESPFFLTPTERQKSRDVAMFRLFDFIDYDPTAVVAAVEKIGWRAPDRVDSCSTNCMVNALGVEWYRSAFGCHLYAPEMAGYVREGKMSRGHALKVLEERPAPETIKALVRDIGMTEETFRRTTQSWSTQDEGTKGSAT
jgi:7-cyano-7-deazaguanine synthase in queuosine biosynthesis